MVLPDENTSVLLLPFIGLLTHPEKKKKEEKNLWWGIYVHPVKDAAVCAIHYWDDSGAVSSQFKNSNTQNQLSAHPQSWNTCPHIEYVTHRRASKGFSDIYIRYTSIQNTFFIRICMPRCQDAKDSIGLFGVKCVLFIKTNMEWPDMLIARQHVVNIN